MAEGEHPEVDESIVLNESGAERSRQQRGRKILTWVLVLGGVAAFLMAVSIGWFLRSWVAGDGTIEVNRPVNVVQSSYVSNGFVPNVLGLSLDSARQALVDAGVDPSQIRTLVRPHVSERGTVVGQKPASGAKVTSGKVTLSLAGPASMPNLVGASQAEARRAAASMGAKVNTELRYEQGAVEGNVLSTEPEVGERVTSSVRLVVAEPLASVFLSEIDAIESDCESVAATVGGADYADSIKCQPSAGDPSVAVYRLNRRIDFFTATVGLDDGGSDSTPVRFIVKRDRRLVSKFTLHFGQTRRLKITTTGALRLTLETRAGGSDDLGAGAVWGDARLTGGRTSIDAVSAGDDGQ